MLQERSKEFDDAIPDAFALLDSHQADDASSKFYIEVIFIELLRTFALRSCGLITASFLYFSETDNQFAMPRSILLRVSEQATYLRSQC